MYLYCTHPPICKKEILLKFLIAKWLSPENCILSINVKANTGKDWGQTLPAGWCPPWCRRLDIPMQIPVSPGGSSSLPTDPPECTGVPWPRAPQYFSSRISVSSLMRSQSKFHAGHTVGAIPHRVSCHTSSDMIPPAVVWRDVPPTVACINAISFSPEEICFHFCQI